MFLLSCHQAHYYYHQWSTEVSVDDSDSSLGTKTLDLKLFLDGGIVDNNTSLKFSITPLLYEFTCSSYRYLIFSNIFVTSMHIKQKEKILIQVRWNDKKRMCE